jgi:hypothetical protein
MRGETLAFALDIVNEDGDASGGRSAPAYIARWGEPQPSDQTDMKQWSWCVVEVGWRPPREVDLTWRWAQASQPDMWGRPAPLVSLWAFTLFLCLLMSSRTFPSIFVQFLLDLVRFLDSYFSLAYSVFILENSQFTKVVEIVMLVPKTLCLVMVLGSSRIFRIISIGDSLRNSKYSEWYVHFDHLNELFAMVCSISSLVIFLCGEY